MLTKKRGIKYFDFGAAVKGTPAETFKKGWGGEYREIKAYSNKKQSIPEFDSFPRRMLGAMPLWLLKIASPMLARYNFTRV